MIGDEVALTCTVRNVSDRIANELTYQWFRKGSDTSTEDMLEKTGKVIKLPLLTLKDKGSYGCGVKCTHSKFKDWNIQLLGPATVNIANGELSILVAYSLYCMYMKLIYQLG